MITTKNYSYGLKPSKKRVSAQTVVSNVILYALMTALAIVLLVPYLYMINRSLMTADNAKYSYDFFTKDWMFSNFKTLFYDNTVEGNSANPLAYLSGLKWTVIIIAFNLVAVPLSSSLIAYSFAKLKWTGRNVMFFLMLGTMMLPAAVTQLPLYVMYSQNGIFGNGGFNWLDTIYPFTIPNLFGGGAVYIFLTRQFMLGIPKDFDEAAKIDGATGWQTLRRVTIPMVMPSVTICLFLSITNSFKLYDQNLSLTAGLPAVTDAGGITHKMTQLLALCISDTYGNSARAHGTAQAMAVVFFLIVAAISLTQLSITHRREVQQ